MREIESGGKIGRKRGDGGMNRCGKEMGSEERYRYGRKSSNRISAWFLPLFLLGVMCLSIFLSMNYRISYMQKTEQANREIARMKARMHQLDREITNLKFRKEQLSSWNYISEKIRSCGLQLRQANPGQVRVIAPISGDTLGRRPLLTRRTAQYRAR